MDAEFNKQQFIAIYNEHIKREGSEKLLKWLESSDFFTAPASSKFHNAEVGGLCDHSLNVYKRAMELYNLEQHKKSGLFDNITPENVAISALLHDLCKVNFYKISFRNQKIDGEWQQVPYYSVEDSLPFGHGEKSVYMISAFMRLTRDEAMAINWHMGGFDKRVVGGDYSISQAFAEYPLATLIHVADIMGSYFDER